MKSDAQVTKLTNALKGAFSKLYFFLQGGAPPTPGVGGGGGGLVFVAATEGPQADDEEFTDSMDRLEVQQLTP